MVGVLFLEFRRTRNSEDKEHVIKGCSSACEKKVTA